MQFLDGVVNNGFKYNKSTLTLSCYCEISDSSGNYQFWDFFDTKITDFGPTASDMDLLGS